MIYSKGRSFSRTSKILARCRLPPLHISMPTMQHSRPLCSTAFAADTIEAVDTKMILLKQAQDEFALFYQTAVDYIFKAVAHAANKKRIYLAQLSSVEVGCMEDKVIKNAVACELTLGKYRNVKTVGIIEEDHVRKITKYAVPVGPVASIIPMTNLPLP